MAGFIKTVNLWDTNITDAIESGKLTLNAGQWVTCGTGGVKSRFVAYDAEDKWLYTANAEKSPNVS